MRLKAVIIGVTLFSICMVVIGVSVILPLVGILKNVTLSTHPSDTSLNQQHPPLLIHNPSNTTTQFYDYTRNCVRATVQLGNDQISLDNPTGYMLINLSGIVMPDKVIEKKRAPIDLSIIVDRSGSMGGAKLENVKKALKDIVNYLNKEDKVNLIIYDDTVDSLYESEHFNKEAFLGKVDTITQRGGTNIEGGLRVGLADVLKNYDIAS